MLRYRLIMAESPENSITSRAGCVEGATIFGLIFIVFGYAIINSLGEEKASRAAIADALATPGTTQAALLTESLQQNPSAAHATPTAGSDTTAVDSYGELSECGRINSDVYYEGTYDASLPKALTPIDVYHNLGLSGPLPTPYEIIQGDQVTLVYSIHDDKNRELANHTTVCFQVSPIPSPQR